MKNMIIFSLTLFLAFSAFAEEQVLTPDTPLVIKTDGETRNLTGAELWQELDAFEAEMTQSHNAQAQNEDGFRNFMIPMAKDIQNNLAKQQITFLATTQSASSESIVSRSGAETIQTAYKRDWGKKNLFAAYVDAMAKIYGDKNTRSMDASLLAGGYVFNYHAPLLEFRGTMRNGSGTPTAHALLRVLGKTKFSYSGKTVVKKVFFSEEASKTARFWVGPVPISVQGSIGGSAGFDASLKVAGAGLMGNCTPAAYAYGKAFASVDLWFVKAGVDGTLKVVDDRLPIVATAEVINSNLELKLKATNHLHALSGNLTLTALVKEFWKFWKKSTKKYSLTLFSWNGLKKDWTLIDKTANIALK